MGELRFEWDPRLDDEVLDWFRSRVETAGGGNYQTLINDTLRQIIGWEREPLETVVRRVVRDELRRQPARRRAGRRHRREFSHRLVLQRTGARGSV